uniref:PPM-type phosphatase domain-containing protein n=1 Tax=Kalanchoe fedtschenkoi TaxID=63787 RepID=A0A7N0VBB9_KALFE
MGACFSSSAGDHQIPKVHQMQTVHEVGLCFESENIGKVGSLFSKVGAKGTNQDSAVLCQKYGMEDGVLGGVFDGHGVNGHEVSQIVKARLPGLLLSQMKLLADAHNSKKTLAMYNVVEKWKEATVSAFKAMDKEIKFTPNSDFKASGTTAVLVIKQGEDLVIANLGDSRAVLGTVTNHGIVALPLTIDHKPSVADEAERIKQCNGRVLALAKEPHILRLWLPFEDVPGLAMTRALGDFQLKSHGVIPVPEILHHRISPADQFVVLATDGVWDVLSNERVMSIASSVENKEGVAEAIVHAATAEWKTKYPNATIDDCTVVYLSLKDA